MARIKHKTGSVNFSGQIISSRGRPRPLEIADRWDKHVQGVTVLNPVEQLVTDAGELFELSEALLRQAIIWTR